MENNKRNINKTIKTDEKLDKMRFDLSDEEKCKIIAKKLTEYIKESK